MQQKLFDSLVNEIFGKQSGELASMLFDKKNVNEFLIAKKLKLTPNQARNILYKFSHLGIVSFTRKKDKRKGWYTYFWTINIVKTLLYIKKGLEDELKNLESQIKTRENKRFFVCPVCKAEVTEEQALVYDFVCPECGSVYELSTGEKVLSELKTRVKSINNKLAVINSELSEFELKRLKSREREEVRMKKQAVEKRKKTRALRAKEKKKLKKPVKKAKKSKKSKKSKRK
jgi:transcription initiation factor TFIIE subunit alpha